MIEKAIKEILTADAPLFALVGVRIRPMIATQDDVQPRIAYQVTADEEIGTYSGASVFRSATIEIDCIGDTFASCTQVGTEVRRILNWVSVNTSEVRIAPSKLTDETDVEQALIVGTGTTVYLRTQTYEVLYRPL